MSRLAIFVAALSIGSAGAGVAQTSRVDVRDRVEIRVIPELEAGLGPGDSLSVGDPFWVTVRTRGPAGTYLLPRSLIDAYGGTPEVAVVGSDRRDGALRLRMAVFRPGAQTLPAIQAQVTTATGDTLRVPVISDTVHVASVLAPGDTVLADIKPLWTGGGFPSWIWWTLAALILLGLALWWRRRRARDGEAPIAIVRGAHESAIRALERLRVDPPDPERRTAAAVKIGDIVRTLLAEGWGISAHERTTFELLASLPERVRPVRPALASLLSAVDLAKFARVAPEPGDVPSLADAAIDVARRLQTIRRDDESAVDAEAAS